MSTSTPTLEHTPVQETIPDHPHSKVSPTAVGTIAVLSSLCFMPSLLGPFVLDDVLLIVENPRFTGLGSVLGFFVEPVEAYLPGGTQNAYYRPLSFLTLWIDRQIWGDTATGFHLTNIVLHLISTVLAFRLACRWLGNNQVLALGAAAIWSVIPLHAETVSYIAARHDVLCLALFLLALEVYTGGDSIKRRLLFVVLAVASFMAKEMAISHPIIAGLHDLLYRDSGPWLSRKRLLQLLTPALALSALFAMRIAVVGSATGSSPGLPDPVLVSSVGWHYLKMLAAPFEYSIDRSRDVVLTTGTAVAFATLATGSLVFALVIVCRQGKSGQRRSFALGILGACAAYLPVSHVVPLYTLCADRHLYIPLLPLVLALTALVSTFAKPGASTHTRRLAVIAVASLYFLGGVSCLWRSSAFTSEQRLYETSLQVSPQSPMVHNNLGRVHAQRGNVRAAAEHFGAALTSAPDYREAQFNLGTVALKQRDLELAERMFGAYLMGERTRNDPDGWRLWGLTALEAGEKDRARRRLEIAQKLQPNKKATKLLLDRLDD